MKGTFSLKDGSVHVLYLVFLFLLLSWSQWLLLTMYIKLYQIATNNFILFLFSHPPSSILTWADLCVGKIVSSLVEGRWLPHGTPVSSIIPELTAPK